MLALAVLSVFLDTLIGHCVGLVSLDFGGVSPVFVAADSAVYYSVFFLPITALISLSVLKRAGLACLISTVCWLRCAGVPLGCSLLS